jgi:hypothetical protein
MLNFVNKEQMKNSNSTFVFIQTDYTECQLLIQTKEEDNPGVSLWSVGKKIPLPDDSVSNLSTTKSE